MDWTADDKVAGELAALHKDFQIITFAADAEALLRRSPDPCWTIGVDGKLAAIYRLTTTQYAAVPLPTILSQSR